MKTYLLSLLSCCAVTMALSATPPKVKERTPEAAAFIRNLLSLPDQGKFVYAWCHPWNEKSGEFRVETPTGPTPRPLDTFDLKGKGFYPLIERTPIIYFTDFAFVTDETRPEEKMAAYRASMTAIIRKAWREYRAVPVFSWHMENPYAIGRERTGSEKNNPYRYRYVSKGYPQEHRYVIKEILAGEEFPRGWYERSLKRVADFLNGLVDEKGVKIPAVVRPYHECEDSWQWWGASSVSRGDYVAIFRDTVTRLRALTGGGAQLLFAYTPDRYWWTCEDPNKSGDFLYRYPGDDVVDIIGNDDYSIGWNVPAERAEKSINATIDRFRKVSAFAASRGMPAGCFETGFYSAGKTTKDVRTHVDDAYDVLFRIMTAPGVKYCFVNTWGGPWTKPLTPEGIACWQKFVRRPEVLTYESGVDLTK